MLDILRLSAYQILFLTKIPHSAAVSEGVSLTKKAANPRAASLVNAVLRKLSANADCLPEIPGDDPVEYLSVKYSHPAWLVRAFAERLGLAETENLLKADNDEAPVTVQVNTLKTDMTAVQDSLKDDGVDASTHPWLDGCLTLRGPGIMTRLQSFQKGWIFVQDAAARLAVMAAAPEEGQFVIDGCAAPGGKSFMSAILMQNQGKILSCDLHGKKLVRIKDSAHRLGITIIETRAMDGAAPCGELFNSADTVIADVPCSGLGIIRKKPDIRYKNEESIRGLPEVQLSILSNLSNYVRPGGTLLYSTCTLLKRENEGVVEAFLNGHARFSDGGVSTAASRHGESGMATLWPHRHGTDGFFICRLRRTT